MLQVRCYNLQNGKYMSVGTLPFLPVATSFLLKCTIAGSICKIKPAMLFVMSCLTWTGLNQWKRTEWLTQWNSTHIYLWLANLYVFLYRTKLRLSSVQVSSVCWKSGRTESGLPAFQVNLLTSLLPPLLTFFLAYFNIYRKLNTSNRTYWKWLSTFVTKLLVLSIIR